MEIFSAMLLGPFEQLEREFGWEGGTPAVPIRPPSAFCSLADIQDDLVNEDAAGLNDSGVCDLQEVRADIRTETR